MARKTRKQKMRISQNVLKSSENKKTPSVVLSAEDQAEARVTKRGILKTFILIALLFVLQAMIFFGKEKGMLPF